MERATPGHSPITPVDLNTARRRAWLARLQESKSECFAKSALVITIILAAFCIVGEMDFEDAVKQSSFQSSVATSNQEAGMK